MPWPGASSTNVDPLDSCGPQERNLDYVVINKWFKKMDHVSSASECCAKCKSEMKCKSFTWVEDAKLPTGNPGQCWLKGDLPGQKAVKTGVVSGLPGPRADESKDSMLVDMFATRPDTRTLAVNGFSRIGVLGVAFAALGAAGSVAVLLVSRRFWSPELKNYHTLKHPAIEAAPLSSRLSEPNRV